MSALPQGWGAAIAQLEAGEISPEIAMTLLLLENSEADPATRLAALAHADPESAPLARLCSLAAQHPEQLARIQALVAAGIDPAQADAPAARIAATRDHFDRLAAQDSEAAVALYSLGDPALLAAATAELVELIAAWTFLAGKAVLDFGCGIGRVAIALAPQADHVTGVDLSDTMIAQARQRASGLSNLNFETSDGGRLRFEDASFDLVLAIDSFPYLVRAGEEVVRAQVQDFARLLRPGGELIVFNWSYRGDLQQDGREANDFGEAAGLHMLRAGEQPLRIWNGAGFHLRRA